MAAPTIVDSVIVVTILLDPSARQDLEEVSLDWDAAAAAARDWEKHCNDCGDPHGWRAVRPFALELLRQLRAAPQSLRDAFVTYLSRRKGRPAESVYFSCRFGRDSRVAFELRGKVQSRPNPQ